MRARNGSQAGECRAVAADEAGGESALQRQVQTFVATTATRALTALAAEINGGPRRGMLATVTRRQARGRAQVTLSVVTLGAAAAASRELFVCAIYGYVAKAAAHVDVLMRSAAAVGHEQGIVAGPLRLPELGHLHWSQLSDRQVQHYVAGHFQAALTVLAPGAREVSRTWLAPVDGRRAG